MAARSFGNPVPGNIGPEGGPGGSEGFLVTQGFHDTATAYGPHDGLDIANGRSGADILAMDAGTVYQAFFDSASGGAGIVRIDYGGGWTGGYAHMDQLYVAAGARVTRGQRIARLDNTGWSSGAHLHMDTTYQNQRQDPWPLLAQNQGGLWTVAYNTDQYHHVVNDRYRCLEGARFRADTNTSSAVLDTYGYGEAVQPHSKVKGATVSGTPWWFLAWMWADGAYRQGAFHESVLEFVGPIEEAGGFDQADLDTAEKAAADKVRDAAVSAANEAAKGYGA